MVELDREDFRQWLTAREPDEVVGTTGRSDECPGSAWLRGLGFPHAEVGHQGYTLTESGGWEEPANWLCHFAVALDKRHNRPGSMYGGPMPVTAKQALEVLDSLDVS